jgi:hypothetical protein
MGSTKKNAEQDAARRAMKQLKSAGKKAGAPAGVRPDAGLAMPFSEQEEQAAQ